MRMTCRDSSRTLGSVGSTKADAAHEQLAVSGPLYAAGTRHMTSRAATAWLSRSIHKIMWACSDPRPWHCRRKGNVQQSAHGGQHCVHHWLLAVHVPWQAANGIPSHLALLASLLRTEEHCRAEAPTDIRKTVCTARVAPPCRTLLRGLPCCPAFVASFRLDDHVYRWGAKYDKHRT